MSLDNFRHYLATKIEENIKRKWLKHLKNN